MDARRRTIFVFLVFSPVLLVNLVLSAANVLYFPWAPLGLFYAMRELHRAVCAHALRKDAWLH